MPNDWHCVKGLSSMFREITDDFSLTKIAESGQCFRSKLLDDGTWRFITGKNILHIRQHPHNRYEIDCSASKWHQTWLPYFDLDRNYSLVRSRIAETDSYMKNAADSGTGLRILRQDPWEMLLTFIISQQKTIPAIKSCVEKIAGRYGELMETPYGRVYLFPSASQMQNCSAEELNQCKLGYRTPYIQDAIDKVTSGQLNLDTLYSYSDMQLFNALKSVHGVGDKVANCIALFAYGRTSLVPVDTWIRKVIDNVYDGQSPFTRYGNDAGIMQQYIFYYAQHNKKSL